MSFFVCWRRRSTFTSERSSGFGSGGVVGDINKKKRG